jgi:hypothetical protein
MPVDEHQHLARDLARWLTERTGGNPVPALVALTEIAAELIKLSPDRASTHRNVISGIDDFLKFKNKFLEEDA